MSFLDESEGNTSSSFLTCDQYCPPPFFVNGTLYRFKTTLRTIVTMRHTHPLSVLYTGYTPYQLLSLGNLKLVVCIEKTTKERSSGSG